MSYGIKKYRKRRIFIIYMLVSVLCAGYIAYMPEAVREKIQVRQHYEKVCGDYAGKLVTDMKRFPVRQDKAGQETLVFEDGYGDGRSYGGERKHEGIDIMTSNNEPGYFQIQSVSDGVVENIGWLELGGYRVGIRSKNGLYFYYAHLDSYVEGLRKGSRVKAGDILGYMGNTGYGREGTRGMFDVHLHFGIYISANGGEHSINPYEILCYIE